MYKLAIKECFNVWKEEYIRLKKGLRILGKVCDKRMKLLILKYFKFKVDKYWLHSEKFYILKNKHKQHLVIRSFELLRLDVHIKKYKR